MELAAKEKALQIKKQMWETKLMYQERMMRMQLKIAQLKREQAPVTSGDHYTGLVQEGHSTDVYINSFSQPSFTFSTDAMNTLPSIPSANWSFPKASTSQS